MGAVSRTAEGLVFALGVSGGGVRGCCLVGGGRGGGEGLDSACVFGKLDVFSVAGGEGVPQEPHCGKIFHLVSKFWKRGRWRWKG